MNRGGRPNPGMNGDGSMMQLDSISNVDVELSGKTHYTDYKIVTFDRDSIVIDTTLTIKKSYKFNFLRKDNFELVEFHNQGQTFNTLAYDFHHFYKYPDIGFRAKQFNYFDIDEVNYYHVPTPTSEVMARTGLQQGQVLDAMFTVNLKPKLNFSIAYKGLRSLGHYRESLSSTGNFRGTFSYTTPKDLYDLRIHYVKQDFMNQESGGLTKESLMYIKENNENFDDRSRLDVNLAKTENLLDGKRWYLDHSINFIASKDTTNVRKFSDLKLGHQFVYEKKQYSFKQEEVNTDFFGANFKEGALEETVTSNLMDHQAYLEFNSKYILGRFRVKANYIKSDYGYDYKYGGGNKTKIDAQALSFGAMWKGKIGGFSINADGTIIPGNNALSGNYLKGQAMYKKDSLFTIKARLSQVTKKPNYNYELFQSSYKNYNWSNDFKRISTQNLGGTISSKWGSASVDFTNIFNYTYFDEKSKPKQYTKLLNFFKIKAENEITFGMFSLANTVLYQEVTSGSSVFRVPRFITRNSLYYSSDSWFKGNPLFVNIGLTFKYFSKYKMNAYNPLLAEFTLQNKQDIGYPMLDVFFNARIQRTRLFFRMDNVMSKWSNRNYFSAPNYMYRDFTIRFGLVWNWFI